MFVLEEVKDLNRTLPRAVILATTLVTAIYTLVNVSYFSVLSKTELLSAITVAEVLI
jgi:amino acid transporter